MPKPVPRVCLHPRSNKVRLIFKVPKKAAPPRDGSKLANILALLRRPAGASLGELIHVTGWREHSVRSALTGTVKNRLGLQITSVKSHDQLRRYYLTAPGKAGGKSFSRDEAS